MKKAHKIKISCVDASYLAGLFDGEGYVGSYSDKQYRLIQVGITNTEKELLEPFLVFGGGIYNHSHSGNVNHARSWCYLLRGRRMPLSLILTLYWNIKSPKKKQRMKAFIMENQHLLTRYDAKLFGFRIIQREKTQKVTIK